ncbi:hypothetical protein CSR02_04700 [Acetobacter pomorum]|uniref:Uncharacterized protein n=1 Tax=Acetobacter pomorum TaxID=65959 RepID=A0A2G4RDS1_9PROT|nr:type 4b pilus protein PilO2 [Acetobacter pomorum]PHY94723.1 hypothetical protein CSR02_04700 [Acetobacter pomorum]GBR49715.1 hypothetical protein AA11825_1442 [Acetobacter pomorum DSM 11825]
MADADASLNSGDNTEHRGSFLDVGGKQFAIGLTWYFIPHERAKESAKRQAHATGCDLYCLNKYVDGSSIQCGLGSTADHQKPKMPPLATAFLQVADGSNILACLNTDQGADDEFYLVAIREGAILSSHDGLINGLDAARSALAELLSDEVEWDQIIVSQEFEDISSEISMAEDAELTTTTLLDLFSDVKKFSITLKSANSSNFVNYLTATVLLGVVIGGIYWMYERHEESKRKAAILAEMKAKQKHKKVGVIVPLPVFPWEGVVHGIYPIDACIEAIKETPIVLAGWNTKVISCRPVNDTDPSDNLWEIQSILDRTYGSISWLPYEFNVGNAHPSIKEAGKNFVVSRPVHFHFPKQNVMGHDIKTDSTVVIRRHLIENFEERGVPITSDTIVGTTYRKPGTHGRTDRFSIEKHVSFSFETSFDPVDLYQYIAPIPALRADEVSFDPNTLTWKISATAYERLPIPVISGVIFAQESLEEHRAKLKIKKSEAGGGAPTESKNQAPVPNASGMKSASKSGVNSGAQ